MGLLDTEPVVLALATTEEITYAWDTTNYLDASGDTSIEAPTVQLTDVTVSPNVAVTLLDPPTVTSTTDPATEVTSWFVNQRFHGSLLLAGHRYAVYVSFTGAQSGNVMTMSTRLECPF
jgi:hypothetical protein